MAIRQTISLEGLATVTQELKKLSDVGESAFDRIRSAVEGGGGGLEALAGNILKVGNALTSLTGAVTVFAGISAALIGVTVSASNAGEEFENLGIALGTTTDNASALVSSFARAGADVNGLAQQLVRAARNITTEWAAIQQSISQASLKMRSDLLAVEQAQNNLALATVKAANAEKNAALQRQANAQSVLDAQNRLDDLLQKQEERKTGIGPDPVLEQEKADLREEEEIDKARLALQQQQQKAKQDAQEADLKALQEQLQLQQQTLALEKAQEQAAETRKNSIQELVGFVNDVSAGITDSSHEINHNVENIFKGIIASVNGVRSDLSGLQQDFSDVAAPNVLDVILKTSDVMKNLGTNIERTALLTKILGRSVGQEEVSFFAQGSAAVQAYIERVKELGLQFTDKMAESTQEFRKSLFTFEDTLKSIKNQIGATFAPVFGPFFETLGNLLAENRSRFLAWAQILADTVKPTLDSILRVLGGEKTPDDKWLTDLIEKFENFGKVLVFTEALFQAFIDGVQLVADIINSVFDTKLNAVSLLFILWGAKILGVFKLVSLGLTALQGAIAAFSIQGITAFAKFAVTSAIAFAPLILAISAFASAFIIALAVMAKFDPELKTSLDKVLDNLADFGEKIKKNFGDFGEKLKKDFTFETTDHTSEIQKLIDRFDDEAQDAEDAGKRTSTSFDKATESIDRTTDSTNRLAEAQKKAGPTNRFVTPGPAPGTEGEPFGQPVGAPLQKPVSQVQETAQAITQSATESAQAAQDAFTRAATVIADAWQDLGQDFETVAEDLINPFASAELGVEAIFQRLGDDAEEMARRIKQAAQDAAQSVQEIGLQSGGLASGLQLASGGHVWGPGTETSDSILAFLSRNEFVQPARRVRQYGIGFMEAIRQGLLSTDAVRMLMGDFRGFRYGGLSGVPSFADGGSVGGGTKVLQLVLGGQTFETTGPAKVIDALEREASLRSIAATGIAQSFVGRR